MKVDGWDTSCAWFRGDQPCPPHRDHGQTCTHCPQRGDIRERRLIIQLGAMGDVVRTTPLLRRWKERYPECHITWVTDYPDLLPSSVDLMLTPEHAAYVLKPLRFQKAVNPDKDVRACALLKSVDAEWTTGFTLTTRGRVEPANPGPAQHMWRRGFDNTYAKANTRHYLDELFEMAGESPWAGEGYWLPDYTQYPDRLAPYRNGGTRQIVGLAIGCGARWPMRSPYAAWWGHLARALYTAGYQPLLLYGPADAAKSDDVRRYVAMREYHPLPDLTPQSVRGYMADISHCAAIVTPVSLAFHLAIGTGTPVVLLNNVFNKYEFWIPSPRGVILEPEPACECFYAQACKVKRQCASDIPVAKVVQAIKDGGIG